MPLTLRLPDGGYMRRYDVENILRQLYQMQCVEIVGMSNVGKSALMRLLAQPDVWVKELGEAAHDFLPVYVDCNRILDLTEQGFCELVLRCLRESNPELANLPELAAAYETLVAPASDFQVPLSFSRGLTAVLADDQRKVVLLFDEFDDPYRQVDAHVFLNLRGIQDRHSAQLAFVTATGRPLTAVNPGGSHGEFAELFSLRTWRLAPLTRSDTEQQVRRYMLAYEAPFVSADIDFVLQWSGGHPRMVDGVCRVLHSVLEQASEDLSAPPLNRWQFHRDLAPALRADEYLTRECRKLWDECTAAEQTELTALHVADHVADPIAIDDLLRRHLLQRVEGRPQIFCRLLAEFVQGRALPQPEEMASLWVDTASGNVLVSGSAPVETLTALEYKLVMLFFQNRDKLVDKYQIVTSVWGESYLDEVDDARIEKLISRLRQKIEPDPASPRFLTTVRGRGYRLSVT